MKKYLLLALLSVGLLTASAARAYTVVKGDTVWAIAQRNNTTVSAIAYQNNLADANRIFVGQFLDIGDGGPAFGSEPMFGAGLNPLPTDNYDTYLTVPLLSTATTTYVNVLPSGITDAIYTLFASDGRTVREKIYCTGMTTSPNRLTGCMRGVTSSPISGVISETAGSGVSHSKNARIAITDNINYSGKALAILNGSQPSGGNNFRLGDGTAVTDKCLVFDNATTTAKICKNTTSGELYWTKDGINTNLFASSTISQLSASTTKSLSVVNSLIQLNVSSTGGIEHSPIINGSTTLQIRSGVGIFTDVNGVNINTSTLVSLINTTSLIAVIATSTPTANAIPLSSASGTLDAWVAATTSFNYVPNTIATGVSANYWTSILTPLPKDKTAVADGLQLMGFPINSGGDPGGATVRNADYIDFTTNSNVAFGAPIQGASSTQASFASTTELRVKFRAKTTANSGGGNERGIGLTNDPSAVFQGTSSVSSSARFVFLDTLYAVTGSGLANSAVAIPEVNYLGWNTYEIIFTTSSIKYYVNGLLKVTNTTTIPSSTRKVLFSIGAAPNSNIVSMSDVIITQKVSQ